MGKAPAVDTYLRALHTLILELGASAASADEAVANVGMQICSFLFHWCDEEFRSALFVLGREEGDYYEPSSPINPFVVITVRNSLLENMHSVAFSRAGLDKNIGDSELRRITEQAIRYFTDVNMQEVANAIKLTPDEDYYGHLAAQYPVAWEALCRLGSSKKKVTPYPGVMNEEYGVKNSGDEIQEFHLETNKIQAVELDGYLAEIDHELKSKLDSIRSGKNNCLYFDSFKRLTQNMGKLLCVMENVLAYEGAFVTANYYIANGYLEQRPVSIRPIYGAMGWDSPSRIHQLLTKDIGKQHRDTLKSVFRVR